MNKRRLINFSVLAILVIFLFTIPAFMHNIYWTHILIIAGMNVLLAASLRLISLIGVISLGHAGFLLIGAYGSALLVMRLGLPFWLSLPLSGLLAGLVALILGYPFVRAKGIYFAILTLLVSEVFRSIGWYWDSLTGGRPGLIGIPPPNSIVIPAIITINFNNKVAYYYLILVVVLLCLLILYRLEHSRLGLTWDAIKEAEQLSASIGIKTTWYKIIAFALGCFFAGISGALFAHYNQALNCDPIGKFGIMTSIFVMVYMVIGGTDRFAGPIIGAIILTIIPELSRPLKEYQPIIFGGLLIVIAHLMPEGIVGLGNLFPYWYTRVLGKKRRANES
jgi:branched-chain amino acid transport system permease protein